MVGSTPGKKSTKLRHSGSQSVVTGGAHDPFRLWAKIKNTVKLGYHKPSALAKTFDINVIHNNLYIKMSLGPNFSHGFLCMCNCLN